jgi:hypothetical protein
MCRRKEDAQTGGGGGAWRLEESPTPTATFARTPGQVGPPEYAEHGSSKVMWEANCKILVRPKEALCARTLYSTGIPLEYAPC